MKYEYNGKIVKRIYVRATSQNKRYKFFSALPNIDISKAKKFLKTVSDKDIKKITVYFQNIKVKDGCRTYKTVEKQIMNLNDLKYTLAYFIYSKNCISSKLNDVTNLI